MKKFCLYGGKKIVKPEIWNITSVELSSDYTSAIIQAESKSNKSEYILDITPLISNQYEGGLDPYTATIVNELTGVSDWVLDPANNQITYKPEPVGNYTWSNSGAPTETVANTPIASCTAWASIVGKYYGDSPAHFVRVQNYYYEENGSYAYAECVVNIDNFGEHITSLSAVPVDPQAEQEQKTIPLDAVAQQVISNANSGDTSAQNSIVSTFNNITDGILTSDYSEFFEQNKQPK